LRAAHGQALADFYKLAALETDDCVVWPYARHRNGHGVVFLNGRTTRAHRAALLLRLAPPTVDSFALHGPCHNPACMNYRHLSWGDYLANAADKRRDGTNVCGEAHYHAKLSTADVAAIRTRYVSGEYQRDLAAAYGVNQGTISRIVNRRRRAIA